MPRNPLMGRNTFHKDHNSVDLTPAFVAEVMMAHLLEDAARFGAHDREEYETQLSPWIPAGWMDGGDGVEGDVLDEFMPVVRRVASNGKEAEGKEACRESRRTKPSSGMKAGIERFGGPPGSNMGAAG